MKRIPLFAFAALCSTSIEVAGQSPVASLLGGPRFGFAAGVNVATISGADTPGAKNRTGFNGGVYVAVPVTPLFEVQPELLYTGKGFKGTDNTGVSAAIRLTYLEVPVLLRLNVPTSASVKPHFFLGPAIAFKTGCSIEATFQGSSVSSGCDDSGGSSISSTDFGLLAGGGFSFNVGSQRATIGARYELGLNNVSSDGDGKNRVLSILASFEIPLTGR